MCALWIGLGVFFYCRDRTPRRDQLIAAVKTEAKRTSKWTETRMRFEVVSMWYLAVQVISTQCSVPSIAWRTETRHAVNTLSLRFNSTGYLWIATFVSYCAMYCALVTAILLRKLANSSRLGSNGVLYKCLATFRRAQFRARLHMVESVCFGLLLIAALSSLSSVLYCDSSSNTVFTTGLWVCYSPSHIIATVIALPLILAISLRSFVDRLVRDKSEGIILMDRFAIALLMLAFMEVALNSFFFNSAVVTVCSTFLCGSFLLAVIIVNQPCLGEYSSFNNHFAAIFAVIAAVSVACLISLYVPFPVEILAILLSPPSAVMAWKINKRRQKAIHTDTLEKCRDLVKPEAPLEVRLRCAEYFTLLCLNPAYAPSLLNMILPDGDPAFLLRLLVVSKLPEVTIAVLRSLSLLVLRHEPALVSLLRCPKLVESLLTTSHRSRRRNDDLQLPRAVIAVIVNVSNHSSFALAIDKKRLLQIAVNLESGEDFALRKYAAQVILNLVSFDNTSLHREARLSLKKEIDESKLRKLRKSKVKVKKMKQVVPIAPSLKRASTSQVDGEKGKKLQRANENVKNSLLDDPHLFSRLVWLKNDERFHAVLLGIFTALVRNSAKRKEKLMENGTFKMTDFILEIHEHWEEKKQEEPELFLEMHNAIEKLVLSMKKRKGNEMESIFRELQLGKSEQETHQIQLSTLKKTKRAFQGLLNKIFNENAEIDAHAAVDVALDG